MKKIQGKLHQTKDIGSKTILKISDVVIDGDPQKLKVTIDCIGLLSRLNIGDYFVANGLFDSYAYANKRAEKPAFSNRENTNGVRKLEDFEKMIELKAQKVTMISIKEVT